MYAKGGTLKRLHIGTFKVNMQIRKKKQTRENYCLRLFHRVIKRLGPFSAKNMKRVSQTKNDSPIAVPFVCILYIDPTPTTRLINIIEILAMMQ